MTCRVATIDDLPRLMQLARMEMSRSRFKDDPFDHDRAEAVFKQFMSSLLSRVLISESRLGFIAGMIQPNLHNKRFTAYETCWYAEDGSGLALLDAFAEWAKRMRASHVVVNNYAGITEVPRFARVLDRKGYALLGLSYIKQLET